MLIKEKGRNCFQKGSILTLFKEKSIRNVHDIQIYRAKLGSIVLNGAEWLYLARLILEIEKFNILMLSCKSPISEIIIY